MARAFKAVHSFDRLCGQNETVVLGDLRGIGALEPPTDAFHKVALHEPAEEAGGGLRVPSPWESGPRALATGIMSLGIRNPRNGRQR